MNWWTRINCMKEAASSVKPTVTKTETDSLTKQLAMTRKEACKLLLGDDFDVDAQHTIRIYDGIYSYKEDCLAVTVEQTKTLK